MSANNRQESPDSDRRALLEGTGIALAGTALGGLLWPDAAWAQAEPKRGGKLVYINTYPNNRMGDARNGKHPYHMFDINTRSAYNGLAYVNQRLEVEPELATAWESDAEQKVWEIALREDVKFHNGQDMTAADVIASFQFHQQKTSFARQIVKIEKTGSYKVRMHLDQMTPKPVPKSHEPPAYAVVFIAPDQVTVHFLDFLDRRNLVQVGDGYEYVTPATEQRKQK